jgi:hypothetical protein
LSSHLSLPRFLSRLACLATLAVFALPAAAAPDAPREVVAPERSYSVAEPELHPTALWALFQLVPSPQVAVGAVHHTDASGVGEDVMKTAFGLRWQLTPVLWSFGTNRRLSPWRFFVVDPLARVSGSIELSTTFEWFGGHVDSFLARPGIRLTLPVFHRGEYVAVSFGTSVYQYETARVAYDAAVWFLFGTVGVQATVAPAHAPLATIATLRLRYF